jgi:CRISPR/Cas system-associated protein Cas5 (RAMP superfamily)
VFDRVKDKFDFPIHFHPEFEVNFIQNGKGVRRIVGDHIEEIDEYRIGFSRSEFISRWETYKCKEKNIHEITIQFDEKLFDDNLLSRRIMRPIRDMFNRSSHGVLFSYSTAEFLSKRICNLSRLDGMDYF